MSASFAHFQVATLLGKRETCVQCDDSQGLSCPACGRNEECQFITPSNCSECPRSTCVPIDAPADEASAGGTGKSSSNTGGIVGGVIGGLAAIAIITYLVWRYCIKNRRQSVPGDRWEDDQEQHSTAKEKDFASMRDHRASTHTVGSVASTALTRASNIIQIAYIPGVMNRPGDSPTSPGVLVPPVPPIPMAISQASTPSSTEDQHFFIPGGLRDSTYSGLSGLTDRTSYTRTSYAARSSVASTIYSKNAVVIAPAQTGMRAKPAMVSVKSYSGGSTGSATPPMPSVDFQKYTGIRPPSPANSAFSIGSTFLNNASASTARPARAMVVRVTDKPKRIPADKTNNVDEKSIPGDNRSSSDTLVGRSGSLASEKSSSEQGPFSDHPTQFPHSTNSLSAIIEEAARRASRLSFDEPASNRTKGAKSPFGDEHAVD